MLLITGYFCVNMLSFWNTNEREKYTSTQDKIEFMWIDTKDSSKCNGVCQDGSPCKKNKTIGNFCYTHKYQNVAYLTS